ncbi:FAD:protein FMN transferase [Ruminiclostridium cellulolyticum]|uniref:FAD:protein FMN transferase n=1 Tax=Ruminiclostridium cellulolyticum (strain ATCC 35319 / DSM 5812 / JCM 6584 / H10) TaxID=394503 RepID=B8I249_RUMCH|nr:FAD:protein FMN transferase [Ruminiclostridium cellulolyticum]ACL75875.1 ApbE family lipoprotein [Ruminiclostridium cellulolyticum H10]
MKIKQFLILTIVISFSYNLCGCSKSNTGNHYVEKESYQMGTIISQKIYGTNAEITADKITQRLKSIEENMSVNIETSTINQINSHSGQAEVFRINSDIYNILIMAEKFSSLSDGAFDITVGPLVKEWGVFTNHPHIPSQKRIKELLKLVSYKSININREKMTFRLPVKGQMVDFGAIAKGYAADEAVKICSSNGVKSAYINLGGNVYVVGHKPDKTTWRIGIQNPRAADGKYIGILSVSDKTVVTSGDYERFFMKNGIRYHHILDPRTGYPSNSDLMSSTIVTNSSICADALSTATFVMGLKKSRELLKKLDGIDAVFITKDKKVYVSEKLKRYFTFYDESGEFTYVEKG